MVRNDRLRGLLSCATRSGCVHRNEERRRGAQYGLFLGLSGGKELGVWYRTEEARKAAYTKLARQVEIGKRQDREDILYRLRLIEACINKTDKRTLRIWKQLQQLLHMESEETE